MKLLKWLPSLILSALFIHLCFFTHAGYHIAPFGAIGTYACQRLQADLIEFYGKNAAQYRTLGSTSLIKWLLSPQNSNGFRRINVESIPGKKRGVAFAVDLPYCFQLCAADVDCTTVTAFLDPTTQEMVFDLTNPPFRHCDGLGNPLKLRFKEEDLMKYCTKDDTTWIKNQIARYLFRFEEALDAAITTIMSTQVGNNGADQALSNVPLFGAATNFTPNQTFLNPEGIWYLEQLYNDMGLDGQYALIGGTIVNKIAQYQKWATMNSAGVDMSKVDATNPYPFYDRNFNTTFGVKDFLMLAPGTSQLVTWNKYKGEKRRQVTDLYTKATVVLPTTGLEVDYKWFYDYDCEEWVYEVFLHAELATVPKGGCGANLANVNGIIRVHDCGAQPIVPACPA
jgi:hypothetical protein